MIALVIAGNVNEYDYFIHRYRLRKTDYLYVVSVNHLKGYKRGTPVILYGTYKMSRDFFHTAQVLKRFENVIKWYWDEDGDQVDDFDFKIRDLIRDLPMVLGIDWGKQMKLMILDEYKDFQ